MLSGSHVTTAWRVLRLLMVQTACRYGGREAANVLDKQSRTADRGWSASLGFGRRLTTPHRKTANLLRNFAESLGHGRIPWHDQSTGKCTWDLALVTLGTSIIGRLAGRVWSGFIWFRIGTCGGLWWMRRWTCGFWRHGVSWLVS
jgi:hypothetical protein